ncbi:MAG: TonB family protein [Aliarcobacter sp.]|nr:TonB family protein [Aliarcobacter sp.]
MKRYFSSFFIAFFFYAFFAVCIFYVMANDKIIINKSEEPKLISLNHIELKPEIKEEKKEPEPQTKEIVKEEKIIETPKPIIPKKIEKKEIEKKEIEKKIVEKITEKKVVEKQEFEPTKKIQEQVFNKVEEKAPQPLVDEKKDYLDKHLAQIRNLINQNVKYPLKAKKLSIEGIVTVRFKINENGTIENITILDGHKFLQSATIEAIEEASKNFPKTNQSIEIQIPIEYKLI